MAITTYDGLFEAMANRSQISVLRRDALTPTIAGAYYNLSAPFSNFGSTPKIQSSAPQGLVVPVSTTQGALPIKAPTSGRKLYLSRMSMFSPAAGVLDIQLVDALLIYNQPPTTAGAQSLTMDLSAVSIAADRIGNSDYSEVQWFAEALSAATTACSITYALGLVDGSTENVVINIPTGGATNRLYPILHNSNSPIKKVTGITNSVTAPSNRIMAVRPRGELSIKSGPYGTVKDWSALGLPHIHQDSCLLFTGVGSTTTFPAINGNFTLVEG